VNQKIRRCATLTDFPNLPVQSQEYKPGINQVEKNNHSYPKEKLLRMDTRMPNISCFEEGIFKLCTSGRKQQMPMFVPISTIMIPSFPATRNFQARRHETDHGQAGWY